MVSFFQFEDFKDFSIDENNTLLTVICKEKLCNYFSVDCVSYIVQSESIPEEKVTLISDENGGLLRIKETESVCTVCNGKGFVKGNFYEVPGETISFGGYETLTGTTQCRRCGGKGTIGMTLPLEK